MTFNNKFIRESDLEFFNSLPEDEKLLLMYDLLFDEDMIPSREEIQKYEYSETPLGHIQVLDKVLIVNGSSIEIIEDMAEMLYYSGIIVTKIKSPTPALTKKFKFLEYCTLYRILGKGPGLYDN